MRGWKFICFDCRNKKPGDYRNAEPVKFKHCIMTCEECCKRTTEGLHVPIEEEEEHAEQVRKV